MLDLQKSLLSLAGVLTALCGQPDPGKHLTGLYTGPYFSPQSVGNLTASVGNTVHLPCRVRQVGTNTVAWVRSRDSSILSIEEDTVVQDPRFLAVKEARRGEWTLIIRNVTTLDEGVYECQISTQSKMSHFVYLNVLVPSVTIEGAPDIFAKAGSTVDLTCRVADHSLASTRVRWLKEGEEILEEAWPDVEERMREEHGDIVSILTIKNLVHKRLGNYTCRPRGLASHTVHLHVLDAKEQGLRTNPASRPTSLPLLVSLGLLALRTGSLSLLALRAGAAI